MSVSACAPPPPNRIVSLSPTATETLYAIGADKDVVAVDEMSTFPERAPRSDKLSGFRPEVDKIAAFNPSLVVMANDVTDPDGVSIVSKLNDKGIRTLVQGAPQTLDDVYRKINELGAAAGHEARAADLVNSMKRAIKTTRERTPKPEKPLQYFHEIDTGYYTATSRTFIGSVYELFGLSNIADPLDQNDTGYVQISSEDVVAANPDIIFLADTRCCAQSVRTVTGRPGWENITAVRQGSVIELDDDVASRWGPRIVTLVSNISEAIKDVDRR